MYHRFNVEVATRYGVPCALVLGHIDYLVEKARADGEKKRNGKYWASKSVKKIAQLYPYYTENTIRRAIERLRQEKLIETGHFPTNECPSTLWYTLTKKGKSMLQKGGDDLAILPNQNGTSAETIRHESQNDLTPLPNQNGTSAETSTKELIDPLIDSLVDRVNSGGNQDIDINPFADDAAAAPFTPDPLVIYASNNLLGMNGDNMDELISFRDALPDELIRYAINEACGSGVCRYKYVKSILNRYVDQGFKTVAEVEAFDEERKKRKGGTNGGEHRRDSSEAPQRIGGETIV